MPGTRGDDRLRAVPPGVKARPGGTPGGPGAHAGVLLATPGPATGRPRSPVRAPGYPRIWGCARAARRAACGPRSGTTAPQHPSGTNRWARAAALHSRVDFRGPQTPPAFWRVPGRPTPTGVRARDPGVKSRPGGAPMGPGGHAGALLSTPGPATGRPRTPVGPLFSPGFGRAGGRPGARPAAPGSEATATGHPTGTTGGPRAAALHSRVECRGR